MERITARSITTVVAAAAASAVVVGASAAVHCGGAAHSGSVVPVQAMQLGPVHPLLQGLPPPLGTVAVFDLTPLSAMPPPSLDAIERTVRGLLAPTTSVRGLSDVRAGAPHRVCARVLRLGATTRTPPREPRSTLAAREADRCGRATRTRWPRTASAACNN